jgi:S1-C subfamily serine protease
MNPFDVIVVLLLLVGALAGARAGVLGPVLALLGAVAGLAVAILLATVLREPLAVIEQPTRALVTFLGLGTLVLLGEATGAAVGGVMSRGIRSSPFRPLDAVGGAIVGVAHIVLLVWLIGGMLMIGVAPSVSGLARDSVAVRIASERLPSPTVVAGRLLALLDTTDLPPLFAGLEPPPAAPVDLPADAATRQLAESALASTALITASGCGNTLSVGSAFFVNRTHAITNAHVVAGSVTSVVRIGGVDRAGTVVAYDPAADLALVFVPGATAPALQLSPQEPARGTPAAVIGYPGGGPLTVTPAAVTATHAFPGPDIYGRPSSTTRTVVELHGSIRHGNSGGPLVVAPGVVGGIVFGASRVSSDVGYAIGANEAVTRIGPSFESTAAVDTGACL